ncbi:MAG: carbohydrate binding domain-containing protein [Christensenellaceae bacterium]
MKKFGKAGIIASAALVAALSVSSLASVMAGAQEETIVVPKGFESEAVDIAGGNEALLGWQYYFYNDKDAAGNDRGFTYESENLHVLATEKGRTGNALHLKREKADGELVMYSYAFDVKADQNYVIGAFVKSLCTQTANNKVTFKVKEQGANGSVIGDEHAVLNSVDGRRDKWTETTFSYKTSTSAKTLVLKICAEGVGDFYVDDITVKSSNAGVNSETYQMIGVGNDGASEDPASMPVLSGVNLSSDSSDGDGKSLKLNHNDVYKTVFGILPHGKTYNLSFKYKNTSGGTADRMSIRLDNVTTAGERVWYAAPVNSTAGTPDTEWQTYNYEFTAVAGQTDISWIGIASYGGYLIDELSITGTDEDGATMQYIVNGSFSGAYLEGYTYGGNYNVAKQTDGTYVFASSAATKDDGTGARGYLRLDTSRLEQGKTYTLGFDYRSGGSQAVTILYGTYWQDQISLGDCGQSTIAGWTSKSFEFVAGTQVTDRGDNTVRSATTIEIYGDAGICWPTYFRNFSIKDAAGNEFIENKTLVAPDVVLGENEFPYGTFEGNVNYVPQDWTFEGEGNIYGLVFDTRWEAGAKPDWKICLYGTEEVPASAISKEIAVSKRTLALGYKAYTGSVKVSALVGDTEIEADENGFIELPEGTESVRLRFTATEYAAFKKLFLGTHTHAAPAEGGTTTEEATCTKIGGTFYYCGDCEKNVYIEKIPMLPHDLEHVHEDATCRDGVDKDVCKVCHGEFNVTVLPATGEHVYEKEILKEATCTSNGTEQDVCKVCGSKGNISVIPKKPHDYKDGKCTVCNAEDPDYKPADSEDGKKGGCKSSVSGGAIALGGLIAAAFVIGKRKKN